MSDIYDIKNLFLGSVISYFNTIFFVVVFLVFSFFVIYFLNKKNKIKNEMIEEKEQVFMDFRSLILLFGEKYDYLDSKDFIREVNHLFRSYLEQEKKYRDFSKLTLDEIVSLDLKKEEISFLKEIYFKEYREQILENYEKKEIYENLVKLTSNK
ncbi:MAG: hypothetical protein PHI37_04510 [Candidatus Gracilibacteria bacterium]|nr:hypothetical protein [Candidatus Gracilibacteria bacterium]